MTMDTNDRGTLTTGADFLPVIDIPSATLQHGRQTMKATRKILVHATAVTSLKLFSEMLVIPNAQEARL